MRAGALSALVLTLWLTGAATAQTNDEIMRAVGEVAGELQVCSVYFLVNSSCLSSSQEPVLARTYQDAGEKMSGLAIKSFLTVGVSLEAYAAQNSMYVKAMMGAMHG